ncbi:MAG: carboxypeptidase regulatory-like domain-containing protein [Planctomycetes bacterium]|nr:carboxypeptidase regulatory-like domain-containing protein [Planctomycetota bacterium]
MRELARGAATAFLSIGLGAQATARLEGRVVDPRSQPVANAAVAVEVLGDRVAITRTDGEGTFVVGRCPVGPCVVRATTDTPDVGASAVDVSARAFVVVRTMPARHVAGTVRDANGTPVAGAWVAIAPATARELGVVGSHTTTDREGVFAFGHVLFGANTLVVWAEGHAGATIVVDGIDDRRLAVQLATDDADPVVVQFEDVPEARLAGATLDVTACAADAVLALPPALRNPTPTAAGRWLLRGWPTTLRVEPRLVDGTVDPMQAQIDADARRRTRTFSLADTTRTRVRGVLVAPDGTPVAGVALAVRTDALHDEPARRVATTAADGSFAFHAPTQRGDEFWLHLDDAHWFVAGQEPPWRGATADPGQVVRPRLAGDGTGLEPLRITATAAIRVRAVVRDDAGAPLPGAEVTLLERGRTRVGRGGPRLDGIQYEVQRVRHRSYSNLDGTWEPPRAALAAGEGFVVQIAHPAGILRSEYTADDGPTTDLGELRLSAPCSLRGRVSDATGAAMPGAAVRLQTFAGSERSTVLAADRDGIFCITGLLPGPCIVDPIAGAKAVVLHLQREGTTEVEVPQR